jgi:hypothetical protein
MARLDMVTADIGTGLINAFGKRGSSPATAAVPGGTCSVLPVLARTYVRAKLFRRSARLHSWKVLARRLLGM